MTPTERLLAAADLLEKRAGEATEGPWVAHLKSGLYGRQAWVGAAGRTTTDGLFIATAQKTAEGPSDAVYIATVHPEVGKAVAVVLRGAAEWVRLGEGRAFGGGDLARPAPELTALADLILAGAS